MKTKTPLMTGALVLALLLLMPASTTAFTTARYVDVKSGDTVVDLSLLDKAGCSGDPCATATCTPGVADAAASGSEHAWADATVGAQTAHYDGPGAASAHADGTGDADGSSKGKRAWSLKEANASCHRDWGTELDQNANMPTFGIGCLADSTLVGTESFFGRLYESPTGYVAYDEARGLGLELPWTGLTFSGATLSALHSVDVEALSSLEAFLGVDMIDGGELGSTCAVSLT